MKKEGQKEVWWTYEKDIGNDCERVVDREIYNLTGL